MAGERRITIKDIRGPERDVFEYAWPGTDKSVGIMLLRCSEVQAAHFAACDHFKKKVQDQSGINLVEFIREKERQEVFRMVLQSGSRNPSDRLFLTPDQVREELSLDEVAHILAEHERRATAHARALGILVEEPSE